MGITGDKSVLHCYLKHPKERVLQRVLSEAAARPNPIYREAFNRAHNSFGIQKTFERNTTPKCLPGKSNKRSHNREHI